MREEMEMNAAGTELMKAANAPAASGATSGEISMGPAAANVKADGAQVNANVGASITILDMSRGDKGKKRKVNYNDLASTVRTLNDTLFMLGEENATIGSAKKLTIGGQQPQLSIQLDNVTNAASEINFPLSNDMDVSTLVNVLTFVCNN